MNSFLRLEDWFGCNTFFFPRSFLAAEGPLAGLLYRAVSRHKHANSSEGRYVPLQCTQVTIEITVPDEGPNGPTFAFSVFKAIAILPPDLSELNFFRNLGLLGEMCLQSERNALMSVHTIFSSRLAGFGPL